MALDKKITVNADGTITSSELIKSFESSTERKILHKLVKHVIPGIHLKLFKYNDVLEAEDILNKLSSNNIESPWCCPSLNYWNIFYQIAHL